MDTERAEGIVLRRQPVTESSLIVTWYTREFGKLKTLAKGARRAKGPFQGKIDLFYRDEIVFLRSKRSDLHLLHDCFLEEPHARLRKSVESLTAASYACELVESHGSLAAYVWQFEPDPRARPARMTKSALMKLSKSPESAALSKDLKKRGWSFVGPTTVYAFMQAMGLVNDHSEGCALRPEVAEARAALARPG